MHMRWHREELRDMHREGRVQMYAQRWHREELRQVQKGEMRQTETCTERWRGGYRGMRRDGTERS